MLISIALLGSQKLHDYFRDKFPLKRISSMDLGVIKMFYSVVMVVLLLILLPMFFDLLWIPKLGLKKIDDLRTCITLWYLFLFLLLCLFSETDNNGYIDDIPRIFLKIPERIPIGKPLNMVS